jgi:hypothetical protein
MIQKFEVIKVLDLLNRGQFIFAKQIEIGHDFKLKEGTLFGNIPLYQYLDMPRILDENQKQRKDVFVFKPIRSFPSDYFKEGQIVELVIPD